MRCISFNYIVLLVAAQCGSAQTAPSDARFVFNRPFAPQDGLVVPEERTCRAELCLNGTWQFQPVALPKGYKPGSGVAPELTPPTAEGWEKTPIRIPSPWNSNAFATGPGGTPGTGGDFRCFPSYPASWDKVDMGWLRRSFRVPAEWRQRRLILHFDAIDGEAQVLVNGKKVGNHFDNFLPFELDVTDAIKFDAENELLVGVRKASLFDAPGPLGRRPYPQGSMWAEAMAGIWQDVFLLALPAVRVTDAYIKPLVDKDSLEVVVALRNDTAQEQHVDVAGSVRPWVNLAGSDVLDAPEPKWRLDAEAMGLPTGKIVIPPGATATVTLHDSVKGRLKLWSPDSPDLYGLLVSVTRDGQPVDAKYARFGWRQLTFDGNKQLLNGKVLQLKGDSWHFLGIPEMTRRYAWSWFHMLKQANANAVRLHAQPYPRLFLDMADEMGIMVLDESAIWASDGNLKFDSPDFWKRCDDHLENLVLRDRNHPSVFGWSVTNEVLAILRGVLHAKPPVIAQMIEQYKKWVPKIRELDPTRPWISGDGEEDAQGALPVVMGHYGGADGPRRRSAAGKPWGVGESGMAYYGTPKQVSEFNGNRAYESMQGRMEGIAIQSYQVVAQIQRPLNACYCSVFNLAWYGMQPLELGLDDVTHPPTLADGIRFGPMVEGVPGVQPERLGPYCTTFNPGYDPRMPLFRSWPLFDALRAAFAPGAAAPCEWDHHAVPATQAAAQTEATIANAALLSGGGPLRLNLSLIGVPLDDAKSTSTAKLLILDGSAPPAANASEEKSRVDQVLSAGGTVLVWEPRKQSLPALNALLPASLELTGRKAVSLLPAAREPLIAGITAAELYFAELQPNTILDGGLSGPLVRGGTVLLQACDTDWTRWNGQPEVIKTGAVTRSEREAKPGGVAMISVPAGPGRIVVCNLSSLTVTPDRVLVARKLFANLGVILLPSRDLIAGGLFTNAGVLRRALFFGTVGDSDAGDAKEFPRDPAGLKPRPGDKDGGLTWQEREAQSDLNFDLTKMNLPGPKNAAAACASFWAYSPRSLEDLLVEPDIPKVDLALSTGDEVSVWLNGKPLRDDAASGTGAKARRTYSTLPLKRGWNHFLIRLHHNSGKWQFSAQVRCSDPEFFTTMQAAVQEPRN